MCIVLKFLKSHQYTLLQTCTVLFSLFIRTLGYDLSLFSPLGKPQVTLLIRCLLFELLNLGLGFGVSVVIFLSSSRFVQITATCCCTIRPSCVKSLPVCVVKVTPARTITTAKTAGAALTSTNTGA